jgi:lysophospholipase L1-like esterase
MRPALLIFAAAVASAQQGLLPSKDLLATTERLQQLMESVSIVVPDLPRAAGPLLEQMRESRATLDRTPQSTQATYHFLEQARKFSAVAEAMPRPYPFPEAGIRQLGELRELISKLDVHFRALLVQQEAALRPADRDQTARYGEANLQLAPPVAANPRVVFLGDSITDGWRLNEYFPGKDYVNRGISGQITSQMLARMKQDVVDIKPRAMVVLAGTNDIARGTPLRVIQNNLAMMCDLADHAKIKVVLASVLPIHDYNGNINPTYVRSRQRPMETIRNLNNWLKTFASNRGYVYLDYFTPMLDSAGFLAKDFAEDGLHPNAQGYRRMSPRVEEAIAAALGVTSTPRSR